MQNLVRVLVAAVLVVALIGGHGFASTYVVYISLDSSIYEELDTLNGLGYLDSYLEEIKPISRVEAARLTREAEGNLARSEIDSLLARSLIHTLRAQLAEEMEWMDTNTEDNLPTMIHPVQRLEAQYVFSRGEQRQWRTSRTGVPVDCCINATEATPLLPNNDGLPTSAGSNEIARWSGWAGFGGFLAGYGQGAVAGPLTRNIPGISRLQPLGSAVVVSRGNFALSFGTEEMWWGTGHFDALSQSNNASPFPALRAQNIHPIILPGFLRYLGQVRYQAFVGQLDGERYFSHPFIDGQIITFKPLPTFEFGLTHTIDFGGAHNDSYSMLGFLGRATGLATGSSINANTNSRGGVFMKFNFPSLRGAQVYQELLGEDNLTTELSPVGRFLPFLAVSYQGGFYIPRLTEDGRTDLRIEYALTEPNYSTHGDSLYWTYERQLMGDSMGPNASKVDFQVGRWLDLREKLSADAFYTEQAPTYDTNLSYSAAYYPYRLGKERSGGLALDLLRLPYAAGSGLGRTTIRARAAVEYAHSLNYHSGANSVRFMLMFSSSLPVDQLNWKKE